MDAGGRATQEAKAEGSYARTERNKTMPRVSAGQDIRAAFFLVTSFLAAQKEVTRRSRAKPI
ncbi:MAG: hypothetical protein ACI85N_000312 [Gammaproteobacteria bacterium]|jgi:hypothetical protein